MKKIIVALGLSVASLNASAAAEVPVAGTLLGGVVVPVVATVVVAGVAVAAADNDGNRGTTGTN